MSPSSLWQDVAFRLNIMDGPKSVVPPRPVRTPTPPPRRTNLRDLVLRLHPEAVAETASANNDFLVEHQEAFGILARKDWDPKVAWPYIQRLVKSGLTRKQIEDAATNAVESVEVSRHVFRSRSMVVEESPPGWEDVVREMTSQGYDQDYVQILAFGMADKPGIFPIDLKDGLEQFIKFDRYMWDLVPGLEEIYSPNDGDDRADVHEDEDDDIEMGDALLWEETTGDEETDDDVIDDVSMQSDDDDLSEDTDDDVREPTPTSGRFELVETPTGGRRFVRVTCTERDDMIQSGDYREQFNRNGSSYMIPVAHDEAMVEEEDSPPPSLPDYESSPLQPQTSPDPNVLEEEDSGPNLFDIYVNRGSPESMGSVDPEDYRRHQAIDDYYEDAITALEQRIAFLRDDTSSPESYGPPKPNVTDLPVAAGRPSPSPPGGSGGGQKLEDPDKGLKLKLRGAPASPRKSSIRSSPTSSSRKSSVSPRPICYRRHDDESESDPDSDMLIDDMPSDDEGTEADSDYQDDGQDDDDEDYDEDDDAGQPHDIHYRLVEQHADKNDEFVAKHKPVFSVLAAEGWSAHMAWRFVRFVVWVQGGNATIAELINGAYGITEKQLHDEYTYVEENLLVKELSADKKLGEIIRTLYRAGFAPEYLKGYRQELESEGRSAQEIENELEGYEASDWLEEWVPALGEIWDDANDASEPSPSVIQTRRPGRDSLVRPQDGSSPRKSSLSSNGRQPYSPSYPPIPSSFQYTTPAASNATKRSNSSTSRRTSSISRTAISPTASELFFRGQNPGHVGAASPKSPRFPPPAGPTTPSPPGRRPSSSYSGPRYTPDAPAPRVPPNTPACAAKPAGRRSSSVFSGPRYAPIIPNARPSTSDGLPRTRRSSSTSPMIASSGKSSEARNPKPRSLFTRSLPSRPRGILRRPSHVPILDPLRYTNRISPPRRLPDTPTRSHQPPSPRRTGRRSCGECGRPEPPVASKKTPNRQVRHTLSVSPQGRIPKESIPDYSAPSPVAMRSSSKSPSVGRSPPTTAIRRSPASSSPASSAEVTMRGCVGTKHVRKAAAVKAAVKQAVAQAATRKSGRVAKPPSRYGS